MKNTFQKIILKKKQILNSGEKECPVCSEFWYGRGQNFGEKERPSSMSLNFGTVGDQIWVKKKDPPVCP